MKHLTLVVGAGASSEYELPLGSTLREKIVSALKQRSPGGNVSDQDLYYAMTELAKFDSENPGNMTPYIRAVENINDSLCQSPSIDNFINSHQGNKRIEVCGKLAIAKCILDAERNSDLYFDDRVPWHDRGGKIDFNSVANTWLNSFFKLIAQDCPFPRLKERLGTIALIVFNYDRCVEHFLLNSIINFYRVTEEQAADALSTIEIYHPYGSIGPLTKTQNGAIAFGQKSDHPTLIKAISSIRTFSESTTMASEQAFRIKELVATSKILLFLGFGYIPLNMRLLAAPDGPFSPNHGASIFATTLGISPYDKARISSELKNFVRSAVPTPNLTDNSAANLFSEFTRGIVL